MNRPSPEAVNAAISEPSLPASALQAPVALVRPAAGYLGGKRNLARRICAAIAATPHDAYFEPFVGMGGIFLRRAARPPVEAINDISGDVATFFRVLQEHYAYFIDMLRWRVASRAEFERLKGLDPPYHGGETDYGAGLFGVEDFARIAAAMRRARGRMMVSINATPAMRAVFAGFSAEEVETTYHLSKNNGHRAAELLVRNFAPG